MTRSDESGTLPDMARQAHPKQQVRVLLIVAHGSRQPQANTEVEELAGQMRDGAPRAFDEFTCAFLQMGTPSVPESIDGLVQKGATEIVLFPYFTAAGTHVCCDLPRLIREAENRHPATTFRMIPHLAAIPGLGRLIIDHALTRS